MNDIAIYGAGGFGREAAQLIAHINAAGGRWNFVGFFDDGKIIGEIVDGNPVIGGADNLARYGQPLAVVMAIADPEIRQRLSARLSNENLSFPTLIHPTAIAEVSRNKLGRGCIVTAYCVLTTNVTLGDFVIINLATTVGHDVVIGDHCSVMPGCYISGNVQIGHGTFIGTGAKVLPNLTVGYQSKIGAGAVVTQSLTDKVTAVGVPAQVVDR